MPPMPPILAEPPLPPAPPAPPEPPPAPPTPAPLLLLLLLVVPLLLLVETDMMHRSFWQTIPLPHSAPSSFTTFSQPTSLHKSNLQGSLPKHETPAGSMQAPAAEHFDGPTYSNLSPSQKDFLQVVPSAARPHSPSAPVPFFSALQASHAPLQALLQQNPSTQNEVPAPPQSKGTTQGVAANAGNATSEQIMTKIAGIFEVTDTNVFLVGEQCRNVI